MKKKTKYLFFWLGLVGAMLACTEESNPVIEVPAYEVDQVFEKYVQEFIQEGANRGHNIDFSDSGLRIQFSELPLDGAAGLCRLGRYDIEIDKANWFRFSERFRSYLLFHELGHCELDRLHRNDQFRDDTWKSILRGDPFKGIENRMPVAYFGFRKEYYLDELFDERTPDPQWSKVTYNYDTQLNRSNLISIENIDRLNERFKDRKSSYEFEVDFNLIASGTTRTKLEWGKTGENYYIYIIPNWGYYIGVNFEGIDNDLFYSTNINLVNNKTIHKISIRQYDDVEQIFINDQFIFHLDAQLNLDYVQLTATEGDQLNSDFKINHFSLADLD